MIKLPPRQQLMMVSTLLAWVLQSCTGSSPRQIDVEKPKPVSGGAESNSEYAKKDAGTPGKSLGNDSGTPTAAAKAAAEAKAAAAAKTAADAKAAADAKLATGSPGSSAVKDTSKVPALNVKDEKVVKVVGDQYDGLKDSLSKATPWRITDAVQDGVVGKKKGVGISHEGQKEPRPALASALGASWYYTWHYTVSNPVSDSEFVPMIWGDKPDFETQIASVKASNATTLLGFNEPDYNGSGGSGMSVERAIELWPKLISTGKRLGSPSMSKDYVWLENFMKAAADKDYKVDFITVHVYPDLAQSSAVADLKATLTDLNTKYGKKIWLTEFSPMRDGNYTEEAIKKFMQESTTMLESLDFVERYAWFSSTPYSGFQAYALFNETEQIRELGTVYKGVGK